VTAGAGGNILVLGIGNLVMSDDGIGVRAIQRLQAGFRFPEGVELLDGGTLGLDLLPRLEGVAKLLVLDAVDADKAPGTLLRLTGDEVPVTLETRLSPHQMGLKDLLAVAALQGVSPDEMVLLGVQPETIELGLELSPPAAGALDPLVRNVLLELERWGVEPEVRRDLAEDLSTRGRCWCP
jgi:hydrogenase maturation protease